MDSFTYHPTDKGQPNIKRGVVTATDTLVTLGKTLVLATIDDPTFSSRAYQLEAVVTRINP